MKNRILSFVLALVMVLALVPVAAIGSSAEEAKDITVSAGHVTVAPGETALLPLYVEMSTTLGYQGISNFQIAFDLDEGASIGSANVFYVTTGAAYGTANTAEKFVGCSADSGSEGFIATAASVTARGGALVCLVAIDVAETVAEGTVLTVAPSVLTDLQLCSYVDGSKSSAETKNEGYAVEFVAGTVTVATVEETYAPANADEVDFYAIPEFVDGAKVTSISKNGVQGGTYGTLYVPASIVDVAKKSCTGEVTDALILKNTDAFDGYDLIVDMAEKATIYYHKLANGGDTMYDTIIEDGYENDLVNILGGGAVVTGNDVTVYGSIRVDDLAYDDVTVVVEIGGKTFEKTFSCVFTTLTHNGRAVVSNNDDAIELGAADGEGVYLFGLTITGVPAGEYDAVVSIYGTTAASNGSPVVVCNDATTVKVTV